MAAEKQPWKENPINNLLAQLEDALAALPEAERALCAEHISRLAGLPAYQQAGEILESITDAFYAIDAGWRFTYINYRAEQWWSQPREALLGKTMAQAFPDLQRTEGYYAMERAMQERIPLHLETQSPFLKTWVEVHIYPSSDGGLAVYFRDISNRKQVEEDLRASEQKYRTLFNSIDQGFTILDLIYDDSGRVVDYYLVESNPAQQTITGLPILEGRRIREVAPDLSDVWLQELGQVAQTGEPLEREYQTSKQRWFNVYTSRIGDPGSHRLVMLYTDITERKRIEAAEKTTAARDAYRVKLNDALRPLVDPFEMIATATCVLGEYLDADQVIYTEITGDYAIIEREFNPTSRISLVGRHRLDDFPAETMNAFRSGHVQWLDDVHASGLSAAEQTTFTNLGIGAFIGAPIMKNGKWVSAIGVYNVQPRHWQVEELAVIEDTAERTWDAVERARAEAAVRASEERFRNSIESLSGGFVIVAAVRQNLPDLDERGEIIDFRYEYTNQAYCTLTSRSPEQLIGQTLLNIFPMALDDGLFIRLAQVVETGTPLEERMTILDDRPAQPRIQGVFDIRASRLGDSLIITTNDVTRQVRLEAEQQEAVKQQAIRLRLSEQRELERQSFAREIHDGPVQTLSSLIFNLQLLKDTFPDAELQIELDQVRLNIRDAIQELRQMMNDLRPPSLLQFGLAKSIKTHIESLSERYPNIQWSLDLANDERALPEHTCLALYRIFQETANNVVRHSEASKASITYRVNPDHVHLEISDNGKGFMDTRDINQLTEQQHFGLAGIAERVEAIHGQLEIRSRPGKGTTILVLAPFGPEVD